MNRPNSARRDSIFLRARPGWWWEFLDEQDRITSGNCLRGPSTISHACIIAASPLHHSGGSTILF